MEVTCYRCNKTFNTTPSRAKQNRVFCSLVCYRESAARLVRQQTKKKCKHCKKTFFVYNSRIKLNCGKYCSKDCYHKAIHTGFIMCLNCRQKTKDFRGKRHRKFCSVTCANAYNLKQRPKDFNFKHGRSKARQLSSATKNKKCYFHNTNKNIELHHIDGNPYNNEEKNWVFLCRQCHMRIHKLCQRLKCSTTEALDYYKRHNLSELTTNKYRSYWAALGTML